MTAWKFGNRLLNNKCESKNHKQFDFILTFPIVQQPIRGDNGRIYTRDGSSVQDELGQRTVARLINPSVYKYGQADG